jgi:galactofuranose transport system substrate-binding protein
MKKLAKRYKFMIIIAVIIALFVVGFFVVQNRLKENMTGDGAEFIIGVSIPDVSDAWQFQMYKDILKEAEKHSNVNIVFNDAASSIEKQQAHIQNLILQRANIIIVMPIDSDSIVNNVNRAIKRDIPIIVMQRPLDCDYTSFIYTDNYNIGYLAGEYAKKLLGTKGKNILEIQGDPYSYESLERKKGFNDSIKNSALKKEYVLAGYWSRDVVYQRLLAEDLFFDLSPDLVFSHSDTMGIGAYMAAKEKNIDMKIIGVNSLSGRNLGQEAVQNGILTASIENLTGGKQAIETAMNILNDLEVEKHQEIPIRIVTH